MNGLEYIIEERENQIEKYGTPEEDFARYPDGELLEATLYYLSRVNTVLANRVAPRWPGWANRPNVAEDREQIKKYLSIVGALCSAEIDRMNFQEGREQQHGLDPIVFLHGNDQADAEFNEVPVAQQPMNTVYTAGVDVPGIDEQLVTVTATDSNGFKWVTNNKKAKEKQRQEAELEAFNAMLNRMQEKISKISKAHTYNPFTPTEAYKVNGDEIQPVPPSEIFIHGADKLDLNGAPY